MVPSFNNTGAFGGSFRYIGEEGTHKVFRDELTARDVPALRSEAAPSSDKTWSLSRRQSVRSRMPRSNIHSALPAMCLLDRIEQALHSLSL